MGFNSSFSFDHHITIFSPQGKLLQIEYAERASQKFGSFCIGMKGKDSVCFIVKKKKKNIVQEDILNFDYTSLGNFKGCICSGLTGDVNMQIKNLILISSEFYQTFGKKISSKALVDRICENTQLNTQEAFVRTLGIKTLLCGIDENTKPQLYKCDPSGQSFSKWLCAIGKNEESIEYYIEKFKNFKPEKWGSKQVILISLLIFIRIEGWVDNASELIILICKKNRYDFKKLKISTIDKFLCLLNRLF
jgi:20S proteasome subunit alpha 1